MTTSWPSRSRSLQDRGHQPAWTVAHRRTVEAVELATLDWVDWCNHSGPRPDRIRSSGRVRGAVPSQSGDSSRGGRSHVIPSLEDPVRFSGLRRRNFPVQERWPDGGWPVKGHANCAFGGVLDAIGNSVRERHHAHGHDHAVAVCDCDSASQVVGDEPKDLLFGVGVGVTWAPAGVGPSQGRRCFARGSTVSFPRHSATPARRRLRATPLLSREQYCAWTPPNAGASHHRHPAPLRRRPPRAAPRAPPESCFGGRPNAGACGHRHPVPWGRRPPRAAFRSELVYRCN